MTAIIPARWGSSRFPGKMMALIAGRPLIEWTVRNARSMNLFDEVYVACDDERIAQHVTSLGVQALMTSPECASGTDRLIQVLQQQLQIPGSDLIANIQGDEPCLRRETVASCIRELMAHPAEGMATPLSPIEAEDVTDPSIVKCVRDLKGWALYFSRSPIPYVQKSTCQVFKHIGVYVFRRHFLETFAALAQSPLQCAEDLEQLKVLEHGHRIRTTIVDDPCLGVNTPEDIQKVEQDLCSRNTSLSQAVSFQA